MKSMSEAVRLVLEEYPMNFEFGLWSLKEAVFKAYPPSEFTHGDTISRRLRESRYGAGFEIVCIDPHKSRYKKIPLKIEKKRGNHAT